jgi:pyrroline-5-carboxylate reductase
MKLAIIGAGNIGLAIANGLVASGQMSRSQILLSRRKRHLLAPYQEEGFIIPASNADAVSQAKCILVAVEPQHVDDVLQEVAPLLNPENNVLLSVVSGVPMACLDVHLPDGMPIIRAMPNTAVSLRQSMTCLCANEAGKAKLNNAKTLFSAVGETLIIDEEQMTAATALCSCGIAFFLRAIRAASQGGIEVGFHSDEALLIASQTARGAASLLLESSNHPESEIDRVTTPRGCTIAGLNQMEHDGFSSAMIRGIITSANKAASLYKTCD